MALHLISTNSVIESFCYSRNFCVAVRLIWSQPLYSGYSKLLRRFSDLKSKESGRAIHGRVIKQGLSISTCLHTSLIIFYSKFGEMGTARKMFEEMPERNIVAWTALISGYSHSSNYTEALKVFTSMRREGVKGNQFTYGSALRACTQSSCLHWGNQVQGCVEKSRFANNVFVQSALMDLHAKCGKMDDACSVFESMETRDLVAWNGMIGGYAGKGMSSNAFLVLQRMLTEGMVPDSFTFGSILRSIDGNEYGLTKVRCVHGCILQFGFRSNRYLCGSLVDAYVKCGGIACANRVYNNMEEKDTVSCTALIKGHAFDGKDYSAAIQLFNEAQSYVAMDGLLLCSMINICAKTASLSPGRQLHACALKSQNKHDTAMGNALIDMYSKSGVIKDAKRVFDEMDEKNIISWTSMIAGYGKHGLGHEAIAVYAKMEDEGLKPNDITFLCLLFACSHNGLTAQGWECFSQMVSQHKILPRAEHFACLVDLVARVGQLEEAYELMCKVPGEIQASTLGAILGACRVHGNTKLGRIVAKRLLHQQPDNPANYVALSSIYAAAGLWSSSAGMRRLMGKKKSWKFPGYALCLSTNKEEALLLET